MDGNVYKGAEIYGAGQSLVGRTAMNHRAGHLSTRSLRLRHRLETHYKLIYTVHTVVCKYI